MLDPLWVSDPNYDSWSDLPYTKDLRRDFLSSLNTRFSSLIERDIFVVSTFLDPPFGIQVFNEEKKISTQSRTIS